MSEVQGSVDELRAELPVDAAIETDDRPAIGEAEVPEEEREWWDDPSMPWKNKPGRADLACLAWLGFMGVWALAMIPLKGWLLGFNPEMAMGLTGSRTAAAATGALLRVGQADQFWLLLFLAGSLMSIKFDWIYWWAGRLWGRGIIQVWAGQSERAGRAYQRAENWANKLGWLGMFVAYIPCPLPLMQVVFVLMGTTKMKAWQFMILNYIASTLSIIGFVVFGYAVGEPAVDLLNQYAKIANYVAIGLVIAVFLVHFLRPQNRGAKKKS